MPSATTNSNRKKVGKHSSSENDTVVKCYERVWLLTDLRGIQHLWWKCVPWYWRRHSWTASSINQESIWTKCSHAPTTQADCTSLTLEMTTEMAQLKVDVVASTVQSVWSSFSRCFPWNQPKACDICRTIGRRSSAFYHFITPDGHVRYSDA